MMTIRWAALWLCILCLGISLFRMTVDGVTVLAVVFYLILLATYTRREHPGHDSRRAR